LETKSRFY